MCSSDLVDEDDRRERPRPIGHVGVERETDGADLGELDVVFQLGDSGGGEQQQGEEGTHKRSVGQSAHEGEWGVERQANRLRFDARAERAWDFPSGRLRHAGRGGGGGGDGLSAKARLKRSKNSGGIGLGWPSVPMQM